MFLFFVCWITEMIVMARSGPGLFLAGRSRHSCGRAVSYLMCYHASSLPVCLHVLAGGTTVLVESTARRALNALTYCCCSPLAYWIPFHDRDRGVARAAAVCPQDELFSEPPNWQYARKHILTVQYKSRGICNCRFQIVGHFYQPIFLHR